MGSRQSTADFIVGQIASAGVVSARKIFGEYGVYCDGRMVAVICDDQLFVRITAPGKAFAGGLAEVSPFPKAKPYLLVPGDLWEDDEWLGRLIRITAPEVPLPKLKRPRGKAERPRKAQRPRGEATKGAKAPPRKRV